MTPYASSCDAVRPLLFASIEDGVSRSERGRIARHIAGCATCREVLEEERALTALLGRPGPRSAVLSLPLLKVAAALLFAVTSGLVLFLTVNPAPIYGDVLTRTLDAFLRFDDGRVEPLTDSNHLVVPATERLTITLHGSGTIGVAGPAAFDLDRGEEGWKLALFRGQVDAELEPGGSLLVTSAFGSRRLAAGNHAVSLAAAALLVVTENGEGDAAATPARLVESGLSRFGGGTDFSGSAADLRAAIAHPLATDEQKMVARFYLSAALSRLGKIAESVAVQEEYLRLGPDADGRAYTLYFLGVHYGALGDEAKKKEAFARLIEEFPESELAALARSGGGALAPPVRAEEEAGEESAGESGRVLPADAGRPGPYVVVPVALGSSDPVDRAFRDVARRAAAHHGARLVEFDGADFDALAAALRSAAPENVLFVVRPERLDVVLHRRILLLSAAIDDDVFPDFAFGYFTAADARGLEKLWDRTRETHASGLASRKWMGTAVTTGMASTVYEGNVPPLASAAGFTGSHVYFACVESDPDVMAFVEKRLRDLESAAVIEMTGNGDPEGIWLFGDGRNADPSKWWPYDPAKVGHDPKGEMPRITADRFAALSLSRPVVWSGTCHSAATRRVFVEGDIVSTFGDTGGQCVAHDLAPGRSLGLAIIEAGAVALLAPIAANHGLSVDREIEFALANGATLGEAVKSTYDDVFLACRGRLVLDLPVAGEKRADREEIMQGGGANRILIGDPALRPFVATARKDEPAPAPRARQGGFDLDVSRTPGFHAWDWDMYGADRSRDWRLHARVALDGLVPPASGASFRASVAATDEARAALPYRLSRCEPEAYHGRRYLHLQANANRAEVEGKALRATFSVTVEARSERD